MNENHKTIILESAVRFLMSLSFAILMLALTACVSLEEQNSKPKPDPMDLPMKTTKWDKHATKQNAPEETSLSPAEKLKQLKENFSINNRMSLVAAPGISPLNQIGKKYSYATEETEIADALREFAHLHNLNIAIDQEIEGEVSVNFTNLSLQNAMELLIGPLSYYWEWDNSLIRVSRLQTKSFVIDYLRLVRAGQGSNSSNLSVKSAPGEADPSASRIQQSDNIAFWEELENQLSTLLSDQGRLVINRLSGTIQVTDTPSRIREISTYVVSLSSALHRQVEIDARILEITFRDDNAFGIDWNDISIKKITGALTTSITDAASSGLELKTNTVNLQYKNKNFAALITALEEQGKIRMVSQPRIRTLNNQPALIKVGTDLTFFTQTANRVPNLSGGPAELVITEEPRTVTDGLVLSLTPQISKDRWVMLDVAPVITRVIDTITSSQGSTAPILDIKQASTLIRARDGEMIILGGLIQDEESKSVRKVPWLADIPWIGKAFQSTNKVKIKKELVIFLIPRLVL